MSRFWDAATAQAGREFGARHYRWFAAARVLKRVWPVIVGLALAVAVYAGYRQLAPGWRAAGDWAAATGSQVGGWGLHLAAVLPWALGALVVLAVLVGAGLVVRRNWWRWSLNLSLWIRR